VHDQIVELSFVSSSFLYGFLSPDYVFTVTAGIDSLQKHTQHWTKYLACLQVLRIQILFSVVQFTALPERELPSQAPRSIYDCIQNFEVEFFHLLVRQCVLLFAAYAGLLENDLI
jgi:hypothetical protein